MIILEPQSFASWDEPIEMLYACHSKVKKFCHQLEILPDYLAQHGVNQAVKNDVQQILHYFNQSAPLHHDDEELDFFPLLLANLQGKEKTQAQQIIDELASQHDLLHQHWAKLEHQLKALLQNQPVELDLQLIRNFVQAYQQHIALEEPLFEQGKTAINPVQLGEIGKVMGKRRGLNFN